MYGENVVTKQDLTPNILKVKSIFKTIQGEGPLVGVPAIFIRLGNCNLQCFWCDTDFTTDLQEFTPREILTLVKKEIGDDNIYLVVITGGEPLLQNIIPLCKLLISNHLDVQIETAGTVFIPEIEVLADYGAFTIVCSPKTPKLNQDLIPYIRAYKYIVKAGEVSDKDGLPIYSTQNKGQRSLLARPINCYRIYVQPCDEGDEEKNKNNTLECIRVAMKYGYTLSLQTHKILGLD